MWPRDWVEAESGFVRIDGLMVRKASALVGHNIEVGLAKSTLTIEEWRAVWHVIVRNAAFKSSSWDAVADATIILSSPVQQSKLVDPAKVAEAIDPLVALRPARAPAAVDLPAYVAHLMKLVQAQELRIAALELRVAGATP